MISSRPYFNMVKVTFEAQSAHAVHTGFGDTTHDSLVVRDANGLPTLPATSIAGVLRSAYQKQFDEQATNQLFGYAKGDDGQSSWLNISWGVVHNSQNIAQEGLLSDEKLLKDELLNKLLDTKPIVRQRVQLNDKGVTHDSGKFDTTLIPAGTRYSTVVHYWGEDTDESKQIWQNFIKLLHMPLRFGQGTRNGYGLFKIQAIHEAKWDLTNSTDAQAYRQRNRSRTEFTGLKNIAEQDVLPVVSANLKLQAESFWRVGGGEQYLQKLVKERNPDLLPMHEPKITWENNKGKFTEQFYILPATAIKGALRHRIAYHYNCLTGCFVEDGNCVETNENLAVKTLFGYAKDEDVEGEAGILAIRDFYLTPNNEKIQEVIHNKIDRYTAGVISGALFSEADLYQSNIEVNFEILDSKKSVEPNVKKALDLTLEDLANGWLPLGASGSRGLGVFLDATGQGLTWSNKEQWMAEE